MEKYIQVGKLEMSKTKFEVIIDESFSDFCEDENLCPIEGKRVLSFSNDYEDGNWRSTKFQRFIWNNVAETALTQAEREALINEPATILATAASRMRLTDNETEETIGAGSELAEIFLYGVMRKHFEALPVVPKIFYKQNARDNAKGADSVHITVVENDFQLWYGEAKFFRSIENARLDKVIESIGNSLEALKIRKENSIITGVGELEKFVTNADLLTEIKRLLDEDTSIDELKPKLHVPIFLLHECAFTKAGTILDDGVREQLTTYHKERANAFFKKQIAKLGTVPLYAKIHFTLIIFPVPEKASVVKDFITSVEHNKAQK